jgi:uncharacterized protein (DUF2235 family)
MALYAFDGTWNDGEEEAGNETNVIRFQEAYRGQACMMEGVGTREAFVGKLLGGMARVGGRLRLHDMLRQLDRNVACGDHTIDIIGFSRGAALALHFANQINEERFAAEVRFLGLWDLVSSFGPPEQDLPIAWQLTLPDNVRRCYHAMALDERREQFSVTRIRSSRDGKSEAGRLQEVWFRGAHGDVGGGQSSGLSSIALCWMLRRAKEQGILLDEARLRQYEDLCDPEAPISRHGDSIKDLARFIHIRDSVHSSVKPRGWQGGRCHVDPPGGVMITKD